MIIQAPPLPPVTEGAYLRAGWEPQVRNATVADLSGLGKTGTPTTAPCPAWECDPYFGPTMRTYANEAGYTFPCTLSVTTTGTWGIWFRLPSLTLPAGGLSMFFQGNGAPDYFGVQTSGAPTLSWAIVLGVNRAANTAIPVRAGVFSLAVMTYDGDKVRVYQDGTLVYTSPSYGGAITNWNAGTGRVGYYSVATYGTDGNLRAPFVLNRCWSDADVAQYYNTVAKQAAWKSDYGYLVDLSDQGGTVGAYL